MNISHKIQYIYLWTHILGI